MYPFGKTVTITPQSKSRFGDRTAGDGVDVPGCVVYASPGVETVGGQDTLVYDLTILAPTGTEISSTDTVTIDGETFDVTSQGVDWQSPFTGYAPGVQFTARKVTG